MSGEYYITVDKCGFSNIIMCAKRMAEGKKFIARLGSKAKLTFVHTRCEGVCEEGAKL